MLTYNILTGTLVEEKDMWLKAVEQMQNSYNCILGDLLLSCGIVAYLGPFSAKYR